MNTQEKRPASFKAVINRLWHKEGSGVLLFLLIFIVISAIVAPGTFFTAANLLKILRQVSITGIMACGVTVVMLTGNVDLSVGSLLSLFACLCCHFVQYGTAVAILVTLAAGLALGALNGVLVGGLKLNSFITTLGMLSFYYGFTLIFTGNKNMIPADVPSYRFIGQGSVLGIPLPIIIFLAMVVVFWFILNRTVFGSRIYAIGSNPVTARFSGIHVRKNVIFAYMLAGLTVACAGIVICSRVMTAQPKMGQGYEFDVITAIVLGGMSISGGKGSIWGTLLGVVFIGVLINSLTLLGVSTTTQYLVEGLILIIAIRLDIVKGKGGALA